MRFNVPAINAFKQRFTLDKRIKLQQSLMEMVVMAACAIMLLSLLGIFLFVAIQGSRYFLPMSTYQVTTYFDSNSEADFELNTSSNYSIEYLLSHDSGASLNSTLNQKLSKQYSGSDDNIPRLVVTSANHLYVVDTVSGKKHIGEFVSLQSDASLFDRLEKFEQARILVEALSRDLNDIQITKLEPLHRQIDDLRRKNVEVDTPVYQRALLSFEQWQGHANSIREQIKNYRVNLLLANDKSLSVAISDIQDIYQPNKLGFWDSVAFTLNQLYVFLTDFPKQAGTSGGVFPAIFGTLLMVILMAVVVTPFGAIAAVYLHEYAPRSKTTAIIRICVSNMAAVPSVVYGVFGLGFFVYGLGGSIDSLLYSDKLPSPTFGAPGLLWASLTMGILTLPVVIVATEEGLSRVPKNLRAGALALGATKFETITRVVLPMASPGILTGVILAIARAAGEVAPLILVGAVKFAPTLPIDGEFPFVHLERQFMHLGVFVYDGAFHNQTESQVSSLMFATCMMLLIIVLLLNYSAIVLRKRLRNKYERL